MWKLIVNKLNCYEMVTPDGADIHFDVDPTDSAQEICDMLQRLVEDANHASE